jgi:ketosteroid isomerase-like protein
MTRSWFLLLLLPVLVFAQSNSDKSGDKSLILALESAWNQAEIHHDANAASAIMADTFISVDHHGALQNRSHYLAGMKDLSFNTAIVTSSYRTKGTINGKPFVHHGRFTDTWIKREGKWQCIANQETLTN